MRLLQLIRFPLPLTAVTDSLAGYLITTPRPDVNTSLLLMGASFFLYSGGLALNDIVDIDRDKRIHPTRLLPTGQINKGAALLIANLLLIIGVALSAFTARFGLICGVLIANLIISYNFGTKHLGVVGSVNMAALRGLNLMMGGIENPNSILFICVGIISIYVFLLTCISLLEDKEKRRMYDVFLILIAFCLVAYNIFRPHYLSITITTILALFYLDRITKPETREEVIFTVKSGVLRIIALDAVFVFSSGLIYYGFAMLALFGLLSLFIQLIKT